MFITPTGLTIVNGEVELIEGVGEHGEWSEALSCGFLILFPE